MTQCVRDLKPSLNPAELVALQKKAAYLQEKVPSFKQTYHTFFIELLFKNNQSLRQKQFSNYIKHMSPDVVFGYLSQCFFDEKYLSALSSEQKDEYLKKYLIPFCEQLSAENSQNLDCLLKYMKVAYKNKNNQEKMCDVLLNHDFVAKLLKHDEASSHLYAALLLEKLNVKQEVASGLSHLTAWFFSSSPKKEKVLSEKDKNRLIVLIDFLDDDVKYREANIASYCFQKYMVANELSSAKNLYDFWSNKISSEDELNAMFDAKLVALIGYGPKSTHAIPKKQEHVDAVDLERGKEVPEQKPMTPPTFYSQSQFAQQNNDQNASVDLERGNENKPKPPTPTTCADIAASPYSSDHVSVNRFASV